MFTSSKNNQATRSLLDKSQSELREPQQYNKYAINISNNNKNMINGTNFDIGATAASSHFLASTASIWQRIVCDDFSPIRLIETASAPLSSAMRAFNRIARAVSGPASHNYIRNAAGSLRLRQAANVLSQQVQPAQTCTGREFYGR